MCPPGTGYEPASSRTIMQQTFVSEPGGLTPQSQLRQQPVPREGSGRVLRGGLCSPLWGFLVVGGPGQACSFPSLSPPPGLLACFGGCRFTPRRHSPHCGNQRPAHPSQSTCQAESLEGWERGPGLCGSQPLACRTLQSDSAVKGHVFKPLPVIKCSRNMSNSHIEDEKRMITVDHVNGGVLARATLREGFQGLLSYPL